MATSAWLVLGAGVWLAVFTMTCALLTAAKRADASVQSPACMIDSAGFTGVLWPVTELSDSLGPRAGAIVVAVRAADRTAPLIAIATTGRASSLLGAMLAPDDHLSARAALTGRFETRPDAAALPLRRGQQTVGGVELDIAPGHGPVIAEDLERLAHAADAISVALEDVPGSAAQDPIPPPAPRYVLFQDGCVIGWLEWRTSPHEPLGWYLTRSTRFARRLPVPIEPVASADLSPAPQDGRSQAVAALSTPLALDAAYKVLRPAPPPPPSPLEADAYPLQITVAGLDAVTVALCCPSSHVTGTGETCVITGAFDDATLQAITRRLNLLGARVLAIFRDAGPAIGFG